MTLRFSHFRQLARVWKAPGNRASRIKALLRATAWVVQKRIIRHPLEIIVFTDRRFYCYPDGFISHSIRLFSEWADYDSLHFLDEFLRAGDFFLDVGANVGLFTLLASRRVVSGGIVCIEPGRMQLARLREHLEANSIAAEVFPLAVSDKPGAVYLSQGDAVAHIAPADTGMRNEPSGELVQALPLDDFIPDRIYHLMKLDVEGFEAPALAGAQKLITNERFPVILFEMNGSAERYGRSSSQAAEFLRQHGYVIGIYRHDMREFAVTARPWDDVIALSREGLQMLKERMPSVRIVAAE